MYIYISLEGVKEFDLFPSLDWSAINLRVRLEKGATPILVFKYNL